MVKQSNMMMLRVNKSWWEILRSGSRKAAADLLEVYQWYLCTVLELMCSSEAVLR